MVDRIGEGTSLARAAIEAALKRQTDAMRRMDESAAAQPEASGASGKFSSALVDGLRDVNSSVAKGDQVLDDMLTGKVEDFHQAALQIKQTDLAFRYTLEVRNKFVDAYREVMRMSV